MVHHATTRETVLSIPNPPWKTAKEEAATRADSHLGQVPIHPQLGDHEMIPGSILLATPPYQQSLDPPAFRQEKNPGWDPRCVEGLG